MGWLFNNFIGNMYGPLFLVFYASLIVGVWIVTRKEFNKATGKNTQPELLKGILSFKELACLRYGVQGFLDIVVFKLLHEGFLQKSEDSKESLIKLEKNAEYHNTHWQDLTPIEAKVLNYFDTPNYTSGAVHLVQGEYDAIEENLRAQGLIYPHNPLKKGEKIFHWGLGLIIGVGVYKLIAALSKGYGNILFLILMLLIASISYYAVFKNELKVKKRITPKGVDYLMRIGASFQQVSGAKRKKMLKESSSDQLAIMIMLLGWGAVASEAGFADMPVFSEDAGVFSGELMYQGRSAGHAGSGCGGGSGCSGGGCGGCS